MSLEQLKRKIKVIHIDVGFSVEDYSLNPKKYGGSIIPRYFKELSDIDFYVAAPEVNFANVGVNERRDRCIVLSKEACEALKNGYPVDKIFDLSGFSFVLHPHTCFSFNRTNNFKKPIVHWAGFSGSSGHPGNDYILLYRKCFKAQFGEKAKYVKLGKPIPEFSELKKEDFVFTCTQHCRDFNSIEIAKNCIKYGIKGYFGGPIRDYPLLDFINNKETFYLGEMSEIEKLEYTKRARLYPILSTWDVVFSQSIVEAWGQGTPVLVNRVGWFNEVLKDGENGFFYNDNFLEAYDKSANIKQIDCYNSAKEWSLDEIIKSYKQAFTEILQEWREKPYQ